MTITISDPLTLPCGQTMPNRLGKAAMTEGLADTNGVPTDELITLYRRWSESRIGLMLTGNVQVDRDHLERAGNAIVAGSLDNTARGRFRDWAVAAKGHGALMWAQVSHAGRQTPLNINSSPKAPSAVPLKVSKVMPFGEPQAMSEADIDAVAKAFVQAALELKEAGFDGVQVHSAHGYLLSAFLSPLANQRTDQYGGSIQNRARLLLRIVRETRAATGDAFGIGVKLNSADFQRGGFAIEDSQQVTEWLDAEGVDLLEISGGNYENPRMIGAEGKGSEAQERTRAREAYFLDFAPRIREKLARGKLMVTGGFRSAAAMNEALQGHGVDVVGIGRPLCGDATCTADLLSGVVDTLPRYEDRLRLGPGIFSPSSRFQFFKDLNAGASQAWYYQQLVRLGEGEATDTSYRILKASMAHRKRDEGLAKEMAG